MKGIEEVTVQRAAGQGMVIFVDTLALHERQDRNKMTNYQNNGKIKETRAVYRKYMPAWRIMGGLQR